MPRKRLTVKQEKFVAEYIRNDGNGTQAALVAYDTDNEKTAGVMAVENLAKPSIKERVDEALIKLRISPEYVLGKFKTIADKGTEESEDGRMKDSQGANRALENMADIQGLFPSTTNSLEVGADGIKLTWGGSDVPTE